MFYSRQRDGALPKLKMKTRSIHIKVSQQDYDLMKGLAKQYTQNNLSELILRSIRRYSESKYMQPYLDKIERIHQLLAAQQIEQGLMKTLDQFAQLPDTVKQELHDKSTQPN